MRADETFTLMKVHVTVTIRPMPWGSIFRSGTFVTLLALLNGCATSRLQEQPAVTLPEPAPVDVPVASAPTAMDASTGEPSAPPGPIVYKDTWWRIRSDFSWPRHDNVLVNAALARVLQNKDDFELSSQQAAPYLWFLAETISERDLPSELALVPLIESSYRAHARSRRGAAGLWQFMPATGRRFALKQTAWYDARRDVVASTRAALEYLELLHDQFSDNWLLAVAAYNCGPVPVQRAIKKHGTQDFWRIARDLPAETRKYVPRLLAAIRIVTEPARYDIELHPIANEPLFAEIDTDGALDLSALYNIDGWSEQQFRRLNPAFNRSYTDPDGPFRILAPIDLAPRIRETIAALPAEKRAPIRTHVVKAGDTLSEIAELYGVRISTLRRHNKIRGNLIRVGRELVVYGPSSKMFAANDAPIAADGHRHHEIVSGDSLWTIARRYGTTTKHLAHVNGIQRGQILRPGQRLLIPDQEGARRYDVSPGDSLWTIARKFNVTVQQLQKWNNLTQRQLLQPGQSLIVSERQASGARKI